MKLSIKERVVLFGVLPERMNFDTYATVKALKGVLAITGQEKADVAWTVVSEEAGTIRWDDTKDPMKDIRFDAAALKLIQDGFNRLNDRQELTEDQAAVGLRFKDLKAEVVEPADSGKE